MCASGPGARAHGCTPRRAKIWTNRGSGTGDARLVAGNRTGAFTAFKGWEGLRRFFLSPKIQHACLYLTPEPVQQNETSKADERDHGAKARDWKREPRVRPASGWPRPATSRKHQRHPTRTPQEHTGSVRAQCPFSVSMPRTTREHQSNNQGKSATAGRSSKNRELSATKGWRLL